MSEYDPVSGIHTSEYAQFAVDLLPIKAPLAFLAAVDQLTKFFMERVSPNSISPEEIEDALTYYVRMHKSHER